MSYSKLTDKYLPVPFHSGKRTQEITHIVIHHNAGINSIESLHKFFLSGSRQVSANYGIGNDGRIACYVDEENRAWTTGGDDPDQMAITIEVSNCEVGGQWRISDKAMQSLIKLVADAVQRYQIPLVFYTGDKRGILLKHSYYSATACPGPYLSSKFDYIADEAKKLIKANASDGKLYRVQAGAFKDKGNAEKYLKELKAKGINAIIVGEPETPVQVPKPKKSVSQVADEVLQGLWGNGLHRADKLSKAGYSYDEVQREVNKKIYGK
ncbi:N-acetylmuramoyl-L-alanine amidase [Fastidiosipila sanguinis]|uniref:N-acetylmuramoyl-L-alanine amidase n=1 Tax=Fastidiosipila sanguinis TaxID=236753 RepID=A0A2S0KP84_9FIRM|nr:N-acetylmuramoyl-L-alanine amidase [Fastidiosipila sanguinis]AVM42814.1 lysozyme [Fastidiosipila sanguinis]